MMLRSLYLKSIRDSWLAISVGVLALFLITWMGLWAYSGVDEADTYLAQMPDEAVSMLGITRESGTTGLMFSTMFGFLTPFVFAGLALSMGASAIAGEERDGTMNVLTSAPRSRGRLLSSKTLAALTLLLLGGLANWGASVAAAGLAGADAGSLDLGAATVHVVAVALVYGAVALALGAGTGNRALASGTATGFVVVSFLAAGLMPLFEGWQNAAKIFPWYYINGSQPLVNGIDWGEVAALTGIALAFALVGWWGLARRDLRAGAAHSSLLARMAANPRVAGVLARLQGKGSARGVVAKALSDRRTVTVIATGSLFLLLVALGPMFNALGSTLGDVVASMPDALLAMIGYADYSTATGWYHGEALSIYAPLVFCVVTIGAGAALAGEEKRRTIGVLLSAPISRLSIASRKLAAMVILGVIAGGVMFMGIAIGNAIPSLGMNVASIASAAALITALGLAIGAAAFAIGGATGSSAAASWGGTGVAVVAWGLNTFVGVNPDLEGLAKVSPFYWALHTHPLDNGMDWTGFAVLIAEAAVLAAVGLWAYRSRDLRG